MKGLMNIKVNKTILNGGLFSIFSFVNQGISFVLLIILARFIGPDEYGSLSLFNTVVSVLGFLVALSTQGYFQVSYFRKPHSVFRKDFTLIILITTAVCTLLSLVLLFFGKSISRSLYLEESFLWFAIIISFSSIVFGRLLDYYRIKEKVWVYGAYSCGFALLNFILSILFVAGGSMSWQGRVYAQLGCGLASCFLAIIIFRNLHLFHFKGLNWDRLKFILLWGIPLIPHECTTWIRQGLDRYIINGTHSIADVGLFSFGLNLANIILIVGLAFNNTNVVTIYQTLSDQDISTESKIKKLKHQSIILFKIYSISAIMIIGGVAVFIPMLLPNYQPAMKYFYVLAIYAYIQCLYFIVVNYLFYYGRNKDVMMITFTTALLHLLLSLIFTRYSLFFTCGIYVLVQILIGSLVDWRRKKVLKEKLV